MIDKQTQAATSMTRRRFGLQLAGALIAAVAASPWSTVHARDWQLLGQRSVRFLTDRDEIPVTAARGAFRRIKLRVLDAAVEFIQVEIMFSNGDRMDVPVRSLIRAGGETRAIDLPGRERFIRKVMLVYKTRPGARERATVELWGWG